MTDDPLHILWEIFLQGGGMGAFGAAFVPQRKGRQGNVLGLAFGYFILGNMLGIVSLFFFPETIIHSSLLRWVNLFITPLFFGLTVGYFSRQRIAELYEVLPITCFLNPVAMAFGMSFTRFMCAI